MALGQIEFTVVLAVVFSFLIFTPEPLVLLRNLCLLAVCILAGWHGFDWWKRNPWLERIATAFTTGHGLHGIAGLAWSRTTSPFAGWANRGAEVVQQKHIAIISTAHGWAKALFKWARGNMIRLLHIPKLLQCMPSDMETRVNLHTGASPWTTRTDPASTPTHHPTYLAILVTTPPVHNYGPVSDQLYTKVDKPEPILWSSTETDTRSIPPMAASLTFRRHFAVCLVLDTAWASRRTTLKEKLTGRLFWDHGGNTPSSRAAAWSPERIANINAMQVLGPVVGTEKEDALNRCLASKWTVPRPWFTHMPRPFHHSHPPTFRGPRT